MAEFDRSHTNSYWLSIVTMALSCIISDIKRDIGRKSRFVHALAFNVPVKNTGRDSRRNIAIITAPVLHADCVTTGNGLKKWRPLRPIISQITTAIRSQTSTST